MEDVILAHFQAGRNRINNNIRFITEQIVIFIFLQITQNGVFFVKFILKSVSLSFLI
jgi:hypothetical protein